MKKNLLLLLLLPSIVFSDNQTNINIPSFISLILLFILILLTVIITKNNKIAKLKKKIKLLRVTDKLTGLSNRISMEERLLKEANIARRYNNGLCIIIVNIDFFKVLRDRFGDKKADNILLECSKIFHNNLRDADYLGRYNTHEFLIIAPQTFYEGAKTLCENLRILIQDENFNVNRKISASFGIYEFNKEDSLSDSIKKADEALYKAKEIRNCVKTYEEE